MSTTLDEAYFDWLCDIVARPKNERYKYTELIGQLYTKEFVWTISNDDNRAADGKELREIYLLEIGATKVDLLWYELECSVLEMLIALARRVSFETEVSATDWFWKFIQNLGLHHFSDNVYRQEIAEDVDEVLDRLLLRHYGRDGTGGLFPLRHHHPDQRRVEIWYQMAAYLMESEFVNNGP